jgi:hypothetical protein
MYGQVSWLRVTSVLSVILGLIERTSLWIGWCRRCVLLPIARRAGYDMVLLQTGQWIPLMGPVSVQHTKAVYYAASHTILSPIKPEKQEKAERQEKAEKQERWRWLSVGDTGQISEFFASLRHSSSLSISNQEAMNLFACQKGWLPEGDVEVTLRSGELETICFLSGFQKTRSQEEISSLVHTFDRVK